MNDRAGSMSRGRSGPRLAGVELYFQDLVAARRFYAEVLELPVTEDQPGHHAQLALAGGFLCLERKGMEDYPSADKAVIFLEVPDLRAALARIPPGHIARDASTAARPWAAIRDPEGHTVLLLEAAGTPAGGRARGGRAPPHRH